MEFMTRGVRHATEIMAASFQVVKDAVGLGQNEFEGMASVFNVPIDAWVPTIIEPGSFRKTLQERKDKIKILWQHDLSEPIGIPVILEEIDHGLHLRGRISETDYGKKALILIRDGVLNSLSIGFDPVISDQKKHDDGTMWRHLREIKLFEISIVTLPANEYAKISSIHALLNQPHLREILENLVQHPPIAYKLENASSDSNDDEPTDLLFKSFDDCVSAMVGKGYDDETARKICAKICRRGHEKVLSDENKKLLSDAIAAIQALLAAEPHKSPSGREGTEALTAIAERINRLRAARLRFAQQKLSTTTTQ